MRSAQNILVDSVDPFIGTEAVDLPGPEGIAASWFYLKAQIGNTHPGACRPFSPVSACPYSGGYVTGYGRYDVNTHGTPPRLYERKCAFGVTHVHHSGTGYVGSFYNYLLCVPFLGQDPALPAVDLLRSRPSPLSSERARPGYYRGRLDGIGVDVELAAGRSAAAHRYTTAGVGGTHASEFGVAVDITNAGLAPRRCQERAEAASITVRSSLLCVGHMLHAGVLWYYALNCPSSEGATLWTGGDERGAGGPAGTSSPHRLIPARILHARELGTDGTECGARRAGVAFHTSGKGPLLLYVGLSLESEDAAARAAQTAADRGFDGIAEDAEALWDQQLGRIRIDGVDDGRRTMFYTALYHSLLKPVEVGESNHLWRGGPSLYLDFATMWDQHKTQLPLVFTLCPERILPVARSLVHVEKAIGYLPPGLLFTTDHDRFSGQSRALSHVVLKDAFDHAVARGEAVDDGEWQAALDSMARSLERDAGSVHAGEGSQSYSHQLDIAYGAFCTASLAADLGRSDVVEGLRDLAASWRRAMDPSTGLMREGEYYEAGHVSYSFRLLHDMASRISLAGGRGGFLRRLDAYFGYGAAPVRQLREPPWDQARAAGLALGRFDGVNNEVALESPYAYVYAGAQDRAAEVVDAVMRYEYSTASGGLPGNDDSGALSSWYVWNTLGLFPVPGQGILLIGCPTMERAEIATSRGSLRMHVSREAARAVYLKSVRLNGRPLHRAFVSYGEVLSGGLLEVELVERPGAFAPNDVPPSYPSGYRIGRSR